MPENQKNEKSKKQKIVKSRYWTIIIYPESAPEDWEDVLAGLTYCYCLHNKDVDKDGKLKKDHIHILLVFDGPTTYNVVKELTDRLNGPIPQPVRSLRGMIRYLIHADNKNKYQYNREDIVSVGMDQEIEQAFTPKKTDQQQLEERVSMVYKLSIIIKDYCFSNWGQLMTYLQELDDPDLTDYAANHAYLITQFLTDNWRKQQEKNCIL